MWPLSITTGTATAPALPPAQPWDQHRLRKLLPPAPLEIHLYNWEGMAGERESAQEYKAAAELLPRCCRSETLTLSGLKTFHAFTLASEIPRAGTQNCAEDAS